MKIDNISYRFFIYNSFWLLTQSFVPIATRAVSSAIGNFAAAVVYLFVLSIWSFAWIALYRQAVKENPSAKTDKEVISPWLFQLSLLIALILIYLFPAFIGYLPLYMFAIMVAILILLSRDYEA